MSAQPEEFEDTRIPGPDALLDFYNAASRTFWPHKDHDDREVTWWASSLGGCLQAQYRKARGETETRVIDAKARRAFAWGDQIEKWLVSTYQRLGIVVDKQVYLYDPELRCSGKVDVVIGWPPQDVKDIPEDLTSEWSPEWVAFLETLRKGLADSYEVGDQRVGVEVKSCHSMALRRMYTEGARDNHKVQVGAYELLDEKLHLVNADRWRLDYIGKDSAGALSFGVGATARDEAAERLEILNAAWDLGTDVENVACGCEGWMVEYCGFTHEREEFTNAKGKRSFRFTCCDGATHERLKKAGE